MKEIPIINGNILDADEKIICQQVNCKGVMGKGLGLQIRVNYPEVYYSYLMHCQKNKYNKSMMGDVLYVETRRNIVANIFSQYEYGNNAFKCYTDYDSIRRGFKNIESKGVSVAIPYGIGCGLGGGNWDDIYNIIHEVFYDRNDVKIYKYK